MGVEPRASASDADAEAEAKRSGSSIPTSAVRGMSTELSASRPQPLTPAPNPPADAAALTLQIDGVVSPSIPITPLSPHESIHEVSVSDAEILRLVQNPSADLASPSFSNSWHGFLRQCARRWPERSGGRKLQMAAPAGRKYTALLACEISDQDAEQIRLDVERSGVDDLELISSADFCEADHRAALRRLLHAWCARHDTGYCQGMNFSAVVLLAVMQHRSGPEAAAGAAIEARIALSASAEGWEQLLPGEEDAFWTFVALIELILPADFYAAPAMPGLQREVHVLQQLARAQLKQLEAVEPLSNDLNSVLALVAYKWFVPCFVNQLPMRTLLMCWDRLLLRRPRAVCAAVATRQPAMSAAHLQLSLALLSASSEEVARVMLSSRDEAIGVGFAIVMRDALSTHAVTGLLAEAERFEVNPDQLHYLRQQTRSGGAEGVVVSLNQGGLTGLQLMTFRLLSRRSKWPLRVLKDMLLLRPPQPPPVRGLEWLPMHVPRLVYVCGLTFMSTLFLVAHWVYRLATLKPCRLKMRVKTRQC